MEFFSLDMKGELSAASGAAPGASAQGKTGAGETTWVTQLFTIGNYCKFQKYIGNGSNDCWRTENDETHIFR